MDSRRHGEFTLLAIHALAGILGVRVVADFEATLIKARQAREEALRVGIDLGVLRRFAVYREDRRYFRHSGISLLSILRAFFHRLQGIRAGGGTTIPQQLARTLFIIDMHKRLRRKILEIPLALWIVTRLDRSELLDVYLCSVRYDYGVMGVAAALRHFFGSVHAPVTSEVAFVLVERIANVRKDFRSLSVERMLRSFLDAGLISTCDASSVLDHYSDLIAASKINQPSALGPADVAKSLDLR